MNPVTELWARAIHAEVARGERLDDLVFVEQEDGTLKTFDGPLGVERKAGHCVVVTGVGVREDGKPVAHVVYVTAPFSESPAHTLDSTPPPETGPADR